MCPHSIPRTGGATAPRSPAVPTGASPGPGFRGNYLQDGVGLQQPVLDGLDLLAGGAGDSVVLQDLLGGLGFAGAALAGDEDALILPLGAQRAVGIVGDGVAARGQPRSEGLPLKPRQRHPPKTAPGQGLGEVTRLMGSGDNPGQHRHLW